METIEKLSLAKIVTLMPAAAMILEKYNLDFCCRGKQTLSEAISDNSEKLLEVTTELNILFNEKNKTEVINYNTLSLADLIVHILTTHHSYVKEYSPLIHGHLKKITEKHSGRHPELIKIEQLFSEIKLDMDQHMMKEEVILFPRIKQIDSQWKDKNIEKEMIQIEAPIHMMEAEHKIAGEILSKIKELSNNYTAPEDACTTYRLAFDELKHFEHDLHQHVHLENYILFPKAVELQKKTRMMFSN